MTRTALLVALASSVVACGSSPKPAASAEAPSSSAPSPDAPSAAASSSSAPSGPKAAASSAAGPKLVALSTADPECALDADGRPWRWPNGRLERAPVDVKGAKAISCSSSHTCAILADATIACWGDNTYGALGDGTQEASPDGAVAVKGVSGAAEVVVDVSRSCARTERGEVYCWGDREFAKAGDGTLIDGHKGREKPLAGKPVLGLSSAASLGISLIHACAATREGAVMCWGQCRAGACGLPPRPPWIARATKAPKVKDVAMLSAGESATCGLDKAGAVSCWGTSRGGVLGASVTDDKPHDAPVKIDLPGPAAEVAVGANGHACARLASGAVHCWGRGDHGQLGDGKTEDRAAPAPVVGIAKATRIAAGAETTCAIAQGGRLFCWGQRHGNAPVAIE